MINVKREKLYIICLSLNVFVGCVIIVIIMSILFSIFSPTKTAQININTVKNDNKYILLCCSDNKYDFLNIRKVTVKNDYIITDKNYYPINNLFNRCYIVNKFDFVKVTIGVHGKILKDVLKYKGKRLDVHPLFFKFQTPSDIFLYKQQCFTHVDWEKGE